MPTHTSIGWDRLASTWQVQAGGYPLQRSRVLLADDHPAYLQRVVRLLEQDYEIAGTVGDGQALVEEATRLMPDLIVADISMPKLNGIEAVRQLKCAGCIAKVIFLTVHEDPDFVEECLHAGALAYIVKSRLASDLVPALQMVVINRKYVSPTVYRGGPE